MAKDVADADGVADLHANRAGLHVRIEYVAVRGDLDDDMVACGIVEGELDGVFAGMRNVLRQPVGYADHRCRRRRCRSAGRSRNSSRCCPRGPSRCVRAVDFLNLHPVDGVALRQPCRPSVMRIALRWAASGPLSERSYPPSTPRAKAARRRPAFRPIPGAARAQYRARRRRRRSHAAYARSQAALCFARRSSRK